MQQKVLLRRHSHVTSHLSRNHVNCFLNRIVSRVKLEYLEAPPICQENEYAFLILIIFKFLKGSTEFPRKNLMRFVFIKFMINSTTSSLPRSFITTFMC
jgi:hypothetical protein